MKLSEHAIAVGLCKARGLATDLRVLLEAIEDDLRISDIVDEFDDLDSFSLMFDLGEMIAKAGSIEVDLDDIPCNPDGTSASDHQ